MPPASDGAWDASWRSLGFLVADWIEAHCPVPDGFRQGAELKMYDWQLRCTVNHYRIRPEARVGQLAPAFHNRRSQVVAPQKTGKGPWAASIICAEGAGPVVFAGFAGKDDGYACSDHGCGCGWEIPLRPGQPMGRSWPTPLIQLLATSEDQTDNTYRPFQAMVKLGPLSDLMRVGEQFTRIGEDGRIEVVTSSALGRLGNPITFAVHDETGTYTQRNGMLRVAAVMRRGAAGMGGRILETTNAWDPAEDSTAQRTAESSATDLFRFHRLPPANLSYRDKRDRRKIHRFVYSGSTVQDGGHVDLDSIEAEAAELLEKDPEQAERFFGNKLVQGQGAWLSADAWSAAYAGAAS